VTTPSVEDVAQFMFECFEEAGELYQVDIAIKIEEAFGPNFVYDNDAGNLSIKPVVLLAFRKLTEGKIVWDRREKYWRKITDSDDPTSRISD